jgi:hypothetical protein
MTPTCEQFAGDTAPMTGKLVDARTKSWHDEFGTGVGDFASRHRDLQWKAAPRLHFIAMQKI